jgi:hypothetical protein
VGERWGRERAREEGHKEREIERERDNYFVLIGTGARSCS